MSYDQLRFFLAKGLVGSASPTPCEDSGEFDFSDCPCRFPFFHDNEEHMECVLGKAGFLICPTSLPNARPRPLCLVTRCYKN